MSDNKGKSWDEVVEEIANGVYLEMQSGPIKRKSKKEIQYKAEEYRNKSNNNGIRYINDDKLVRKPQKVMAKITKEELWNLMIENAGNENDKKTVLQLAIDKCKIDLETIYVEDKDLTYDEDIRPIDIVGTPLFGLQEIDGYTFFGLEIGVLSSAFCIIYYDGEKLRGYYPSCGNLINLDFNCILGLEEEYESKHFEEYEEDEYYDLDLSDIYLSKYNLISDNYGYNWELIEKDIKAMFELR